MYELYCHAGESWERSGDVAASGFIKYDCEFRGNAYGAETRYLQEGTPIWAAFDPDRSDGSAPGYNVWAYINGSVVWLDGGDGGDLTNYYPMFEWVEEDWNRVESGYQRGEFR